MTQLVAAPDLADDLASDLKRAEGLLQAAIDGTRAESGERGACRTEPLRRCAAIFRLTADELDVMLLALAAEVDPRLSKLFARAQGDPTTRRPTVATLLAALGRGSHDPALLAALSGGGHLMRTGLIELGGDAPFPERVVRIPEAFWPRLIGLEAAPPFRLALCEPDALQRLVISRITRSQIQEVVARSRGEAAHKGLICIAGRPGSGRESLAVALAGELGFASLLIDARIAESAAAAPHLAREAAWNLAALVVHEPPSELVLARLAPELSTPIVVITDDRAAPEGGELRHRWRADVTVTSLDAAERERVWRAHLAGAELGSEVDLRAVATRLPIGPGRIAAVAAAARRAVSGRRPISPADLRDACRRGAHDATSRLAHRLDAGANLDDLVLPIATRRELELAIAWARRGPAVFHPDGPGRLLRGHTGLVCLFHGPPGTGKTLAARVLSASIDADLLRIDLSQVVNKYIGETEKNLERVFEEAESTGAVLFFDEADALFGKRSEVKDAHDRYANIETAFLLQRLEAQRGVCILASNLRQNLDEAFSRRIHVSAEFVLPTKEERRRIWELQLPREHLAADVDLALLADRAVLAGGDIRNAAATSAVLASIDGGTVKMKHLVIATFRELRKSGRLVAPEAFGPWRDAILDYTRGELPMEKT